MDSLRNWNWLQQELLRGVYNSGLQQKLLQERKPELEDLIKIATLWQNADSAQVVMGKEPSEDLRHSQTEKELLPPNEDDERCSDDCDIK